MATPSNPLLDRLHRWSLALSLPSESPEVDAMMSERRVTPKGLLAKKSSPDAALLAAVAFVDAWSLGCPGTSKEGALKLVEELLELQEKHGLCRLRPDDPQPTPEDEISWDAAMAAILQVAHQNRNMLLLLANTAGSWWRELLEDGRLRPTLRFEGGELAEHMTLGREAVGAFVIHGEVLPLDTGDPLLIAPRLFYLMPDVPLPLGERTWGKKGG